MRCKVRHTKHCIGASVKAASRAGLTVEIAHQQVVHHSRPLRQEFSSADAVIVLHLHHRRQICLARGGLHCQRLQIQE
jgi:hypothetical protein